ncbi:MAG TPA: Rieske (2Fe-2S) protein [Candidatus Binataceae bacterium]|nr:Rieske (2Fe-2S) protein [Candidatus Binataceae bacterium]
MLTASLSVEKSAVWVLAGSVDQIALGQGRCFVAGKRKIALFRLRNGEIYALDAVCPHREGPLAEGVIGNGTVVCPLHGYRFSLRDGHGVDNHSAVNSYPVATRAGMIYVRLPGTA